MNTRSIAIDNELLKEICSSWVDDGLDIKLQVFFSMWSDNKSSDDTAAMLNELMPLLYDGAENMQHDRFRLREYLVTATALLIEASKNVVNIESLNVWKKWFGRLNIHRAETDRVFSGLEFWDCWIGMDDQALNAYQKSLLLEYEVTEVEKLSYSKMIKCMHQFEARQYFAKFSNLYSILGDKTDKLLSGVAEGSHENFYVKYNPLNVQYFRPILSQLLEKEDAAKRSEFLLYLASSVSVFARLLQVIYEARIDSAKLNADTLTGIKEMTSSDFTVDQVKLFIDNQLKVAYSLILKTGFLKEAAVERNLDHAQIEVLRDAKRCLQRVCMGAAIATFFNAPRDIGVEVAQYLQPHQNKAFLHVSSFANNAAREALKIETPGFREFIKRL